jgi:SAM-dependent methyltransferase
MIITDDRPSPIMNKPHFDAPFHRLHELRMENDAARYEQEELRGRFDTIRNRHENGTAPRAVSTYQLFQTPISLAARLVALLGLAGGERILEPSAGLGRILDAIAPYKPSEVTAVEIAPRCAGELFVQNRTGVIIKQRNFLTMSQDDIETFDCIAMNPPFHMRSDIAHILHARKFLRPGGRLAALCMDTRHRLEQLKPLSSHWETIPAGEFQSEGTGIGTILLTIEN